MQTTHREKTRPAATGTGPKFKNSARSLSPVDLLLERLEKVKQTRPDRWQACCPAHDDKSPSLTITETGEGTVLVKCWAGCGAAAIVGAVGLELRDLFPPKFDGKAYQASKPPRYSAVEIVKTLLMESTILMLGYRALQRGEELNLADQGRVELAIDAINNCGEVIR